MYVFEALKYLMYQESTRELIYTARSWEKRRDIRGIELNDLTEYSKKSHIFSIEWHARVVNNTYEIYELRTSNEYSFKKFHKLFSRVRPGRYTDSDGKQILRE